MSSSVNYLKVYNCNYLLLMYSTEGVGRGRLWYVATSRINFVLHAVYQYVSAPRTHPYYSVPRSSLISVRVSPVLLLCLDRARENQVEF